MSEEQFNRLPLAGIRLGIRRRQRTSFPGTDAAANAMKSDPPQYVVTLDAAGFAFQTTEHTMPNNEQIGWK